MGKKKRKKNQRKVERTRTFIEIVIILPAIIAGVLLIGGLFYELILCVAR